MIQLLSPQGSKGTHILRKSLTWFSIGVGGAILSFIAWGIVEPRFGRGGLYISIMTVAIVFVAVSLVAGFKWFLVGFTQRAIAIARMEHENMTSSPSSEVSDSQGSGGMQKINFRRGFVAVVGLIAMGNLIGVLVWPYIESASDSNPYPILIICVGFLLAVLLIYVFGRAAIIKWLMK